MFFIRALLIITEFTDSRMEYLSKKLVKSKKKEILFKTIII